MRSRFLHFALGCALAACETYLDLPEADLIEVRPTLEEAAGPLCRDYCDVVMENCTGAYQVYGNRIQCLHLCSVMAPGSEGEVEGNTVQCRLTNARLAAETVEPASHCPQAGPGGAAADPGVSCTTNCEGLCAGMLQICPEQYLSLSACLADCGSVPDLGGYDLSTGQGATVQCRLFHLGAAAAAPASHCGHAAGETPCR